MKLLLLLSDEAQIAHRRDAELKSVQEEKEDAKQKVAAFLDVILKQQDYETDASNGNDQTMTS
jgi:mediator of RNA polymerase II transcription subunit 22